MLSLGNSPDGSIRGPTVGAFKSLKACYVPRCDWNDVGPRVRAAVQSTRRPQLLKKRPLFSVEDLAPRSHQQVPAMLEDCFEQGSVLPSHHRVSQSEATTESKTSELVLQGAVLPQLDTASRLEAAPPRTPRRPEKKLTAREIQEMIRPVIPVDSLLGSRWLARLPQPDAGKRGKGLHGPVSAILEVQGSSGSGVGGGTPEPRVDRCEPPPCAAIGRPKRAASGVRPRRYPYLKVVESCPPRGSSAVPIHVVHHRAPRLETTMDSAVDTRSHRGGGSLSVSCTVIAGDWVVHYSSWLRMS